MRAKQELILQAGLYIHGEMIRTGFTLVIVVLWLTWCIVGWVWYNETTSCSDGDDLKTSVWWNLLIGTIVYAILLPCVCCLWLGTSVASAAMRSENGDSEASN